MQLKQNILMKKKKPKQPFIVLDPATDKFRLEPLIHFRKMAKPKMETTQITSPTEAFLFDGSPESEYVLDGIVEARHLELREALRDHGKKSIDKLKDRLSKFYQDKIQDLLTRKLSVDDVFKNLKANKQDLRKAIDYLADYGIMLQYAKDNNQLALAEDLKRNIDVVNKEIMILSVGYDAFVSENSMIVFCEKCKDKMALTWVNNFTRIIPVDVAAHIHKLNTLDIFHNYLILHYDPKGDSSQLTKKEKEKKRDPILFGVIEGSDKLYYIADWIDEYCDLSFSELVDAGFADSLTELGKKTLEETIDV